MAALMEISPVLTSPSALAAADAAPNLAGSGVVALTKGLSSGNEAAFREFHELYSSRLLRYHLVLARGDEQSAREALQETFLRVVRHARRFDDEPSFWCWLTVLARSAAFDAGRRRQRYWRLISNYAHSLIFRTAKADSEDADARLYECLLDSLKELEALDRSLVEGKYLRRASVHELAVESGLTPKAVESRLLRARRVLREKSLRRMHHEQ